MEQLLTVNEIAKRLNVGRATVYTLKKRFPDFPQPIQLGPQSPRWRPADMEVWIETHRSTVTQ